MSLTGANTRTDDTAISDGVANVISNGWPISEDTPYCTLPIAALITAPDTAGSFVVTVSALISVASSEMSIALH